MVNVEVALVVALSSDTDAGLSEQLILAVEEEVLQERAIAPLKPPVALAVMVEVAD
jgi:hypothetical protein